MRARLTRMARADATGDVCGRRASTTRRLVDSRIDGLQWFASRADCAAARVYFRLCVFILYGFVARSDYEEEIAALYRASKMVCVLAASSAFKLFKTAEPVEPVRPLAAV